MIIESAKKGERSETLSTEDSYSLDLPFFMSVILSPYIQQDQLLELFKKLEKFILSGKFALSFNFEDSYALIGIFLKDLFLFISYDYT
jgi:hypothetical protein